MRPSRLLRPSRNCPHRCSQSCVGGDAVHPPRPRPCQGRPAAVGQQHGRGRGELAAGAVLRNHRGLTSAERVKAVFRWCRAHSGDARAAREKPAAMPTDADIDFLFSVCSASPSREAGGPEWDDGAVREDLRHGARRPFWPD